MAAFEKPSKQSSENARHCLDILDALEELIYEKMTSRPYNILQRFKNRRKYRKVNSIIAYWNDHDCKSANEAIQMMKCAENKVGLSKAYTNPENISPIVIEQITKILSEETNKELVLAK